MQHPAFYSILSATLILGLTFGAGPVAAESGFAEGRILVKPAPGLSDEKFHRVLGRANGKAKSKRKLRGSTVHVVEVPAKSEKAVAMYLAKHPNITFAELDERVPPNAVVNDPDYNRQWHLPLMAAPSAWQFGDGSNVVVAVLDTGANANHSDLSGRVLSGWNTVSNNTDTADIHNHGTWVAGVIAAKANNLVGGASVAPGAKILPIRITNDSAGYAYFSDMAEGITWAADNGARVANLSYGGAAGSATVANAASYMMGKGGVVMVAAGNDNTNYGYTNHASLYVAGATTSSEAKASYSSFGNFVDISAPGSGIYTTSRSGGYSTVNGTSFAAPNAAAVAALVMSVNPTLLPTDVMAVISNSAVDLGAPGWDPAFGHGRVDALAAVQMAAAVETSDTVAPQVAIVSPTANAIVSEELAVMVEASDGFGVARVDFLVDGQLIASETQSVTNNQYRFAWDSSQMRDGQYKLSARAVDPSGNTGIARDVYVRVANTIDDIAPQVTILSPAANGSGTRSVTLSASATDDQAVTQISIYAGGQLRCASTSSTSCSWNLRKVAPGTYTISALAEDAAGNQGSASVTFAVEGSSSGGGGKGGGKGRKNR